MTQETRNSALTVEQFEFYRKLEGIFMPQATRQREDIYRRQVVSGAVADSLKFVHYTSAEAALKIINSKRLWMRNTTCMTDYREVQHGFGILQKFFSDKPKTAQFIQALDVCVPVAAAEAIGAFNRWWGSGEIPLCTYIASISEHDVREDSHGRLSMWRACGGNTPRVAMVLTIPWMSGVGDVLSLMFSPVAYVTEDEAHAVIY